MKTRLGTTVYPSKNLEAGYVEVIYRQGKQVFTMIRHITDLCIQKTESKTTMKIVERAKKQYFMMNQIKLPFTESQKVCGV